jgi:hypothetical protein
MNQAENSHPSAAIREQLELIRRRLQGDPQTVVDEIVRALVPAPTPPARTARRPG